MLFIGVVLDLEPFGDLQAAGTYMVSERITCKKLSATYMLNQNSKVSSDQFVFVHHCDTDRYNFFGSMQFLQGSYKLCIVHGYVRSVTSRLSSASTTVTTQGLF